MHRDFSVLEPSPVAISIADPELDDMPLVFVNRAFEDLTGYSRDFCIGKNCRFLQGNAGPSKEVKALREALINRVSCSVCLENRKSGGEQFYNYLFLAPFQDIGNKLYFLGCQFEFRHTTRQRDLDLHTKLLSETIYNNLETRRTVADTVVESMRLRSERALIRIQNYLRSQKTHESGLLD